MTCINLNSKEKTTMVNFREKFAKDNVFIVVKYRERVPRGLTPQEENFFLSVERKVFAEEELECEEFSKLTLLADEVKHLNKPRVFSLIRPSLSTEPENESTTWSDVASAGYQ